MFSALIPLGGEEKAKAQISSQRITRLPHPIEFLLKIRRGILQDNRYS